MNNKILRISSAKWLLVLQSYLMDTVKKLPVVGSHVESHVLGAH